MSFHVSSYHTEAVVDLHFVVQTFRIELEDLFGPNLKAIISL